MTSIDNERLKEIYSEQLDELNDLFGTKITNISYIPELFDFYNNCVEFEKGTGCTFEELETCGTGAVLSSGEYVFLNEINYDWKTDKSILFDDTER